MIDGKVNQKLSMPKLDVKGNFKYIIIDGKHVKLTHGEVLLIAMGVTPDKERTILDITLAKEENKRSYCELLVRLWKKYNVVIIVADGAKALDIVINASQMKIKRQCCIVHMKRNMSKGERLDKLIKWAEEGETVVDKYGVLNYLEAQREVWKWLKSNNLVESFNSLVERRCFGKFHSPWRIFQIARAIAIAYNLFTNYLITVILLQLSLFLSLLSIYLDYFFLELY